MTKTLAKEWGRYKVNVNCVAFGFIKTRMTQPIASEAGAPGDVRKVGVQPAMLDASRAERDPARTARNTRGSGRRRVSASALRSRTTSRARSSRSAEGSSSDAAPPEGRALLGLGRGAARLCVDEQGWRRASRAPCAAPRSRRRGHASSRVSARVVPGSTRASSARRDAARLHADGGRLRTRDAHERRSRRERLPGAVPRAERDGASAEMLELVYAGAVRAREGRGVAAGRDDRLRGRAPRG